MSRCLTRVALAIVAAGLFSAVAQTVSANTLGPRHATATFIALTGWALTLSTAITSIGALIWRTLTTVPAARRQPAIPAGPGRRRADAGTMAARPVTTAAAEQPLTIDAAASATELDQTAAYGDGWDGFEHALAVPSVADVPAGDLLWYAPAES